jgi:hypothetical protein
MAVIKRITPGSAFKLGLVVYGILGLVLGAFVELLVLSRMNLAGANQPPRNIFFPFGPGAIILLPIIYGLVGGVFGAIGALIYNLASKWVGGLQIDIS